MALQPSEFEKVVIGSSRPFAVSPPMPSLDWLGVVITAPRLVSKGLAAPLPVCMFYKLPIDPDAADLVAELMLSRPDGLVLRGKQSLEDPEVEAPMPRAQLSKSELAGMASGGYYNFDLRARIPLPAQDMILRLQVRLRGHMSNAVDIAWSP